MPVSNLAHSWTLQAPILSVDKNIVWQTNTCLLLTFSLYLYVRFLQDWPTVVCHFNLWRHINRLLLRGRFPNMPNNFQKIVEYFYFLHLNRGRMWNTICVKMLLINTLIIMKYVSVIVKLLLLLWNNSHCFEIILNVMKYLLVLIKHNFLSVLPNSSSQLCFTTDYVCQSK